MNDLIIKFQKSINNELEQEVLAKEIFKHFEPMVNSLSHKFVISVEHYDFEDLKSEAFIELYQSLHCYNTDSKATFSTYVYSRIKHRFIKLIRQNKAQKRDMGNYTTLETNVGYTNLTFESIVADSSPNLYELFGTVEYEDALERIKKLLPPNELEMYLYYLQVGDVNLCAKKYDMEFSICKNKIAYIRRKIRKNRKKKQL